MNKICTIAEETFIYIYDFMAEDLITWLCGQDQGQRQEVKILFFFLMNGQWFWFWS